MARKNGRDKADRWPNWVDVVTEIGLPDTQIAELVGCTRGAIQQLRNGSTADPRYSIGSALLRLMADRCGRD